MAESSGGGTGQLFRIKGRPRALRYPTTTRRQSPSAKRRADLKAGQARGVTRALGNPGATRRSSTATAALLANAQKPKSMTKTGDFTYRRNDDDRRTAPSALLTNALKPKSLSKGDPMRFRRNDDDRRTAPVRPTTKRPTRGPSRKAPDNSALGRAARALTSGGMIASTLTRSLPSSLGGAPIPVPLPARIALAGAGYLAGQVGLRGKTNKARGRSLKKLIR